MGGLLGGARGWGVHAEAGAHYEEAVEKGAVLVIVTGDRAELMEAEASLLTTGPREIKTFATSESEV